MLIAMTRTNDDNDDDDDDKALFFLSSGAASSGDIDVLLTHPTYLSTDDDFDKVGCMNSYGKYAGSIFSLAPYSQRGKGFRVFLTLSLS